MRRQLVGWMFVAALLFAVTGASAAGVGNAVFYDGFDSYLNGSDTHGQGGWKGWDNSPAAGAFVTDVQQSSFLNSVNITLGSDLVHEWTDLTSGQWVVSAKQFIPSTSLGTGTSYFLLLNQYNDGGPYNWSVQNQFDLNSGTVNDCFENTGTGTTLPLIMDQWVDLRADIDLDADVVNVYYGGSLLSTHP